MRNRNFGKEKSGRNVKPAVEEIEYGGYVYTVRVVAKNGHEFRVGTLDLEDALLTEDGDAFVDRKAQRIDDTIAYYVPEGDFKAYGYDIANVPDDVLIDYIKTHADDKVTALLGENDEVLVEKIMSKIKPVITKTINESLALSRRRSR